MQLAKQLIRSVGRTQGAPLDRTTMAESPESWNLLTASLAVCDLSQPRSAWAFLILQGLVRDSDDEREVFLRFVREEQARGPITGWTLPRRVAESLATGGITSSAAQVADPWGRTAADRLESVASWGPDAALRSLSPETLRWLRELERHAGDHTRRPPTKPWWKVW
jgi:hypothetical protein